MRVAAFDEKLGLSRLVFPYVENHNFYIEHWSLSLFWRRVRELGAVLAGAGFWAEAEDIFLLRRDEIPQAIFDYGNGWAVGAECAGPYHWPAEIERRKGILAALARQAAAAGDERAARGGHRAVHDHALRHHVRARLAVALGRRTATAGWPAWRPRRAGRGRRAGRARRRRAA